MQLPKKITIEWKHYDLLGETCDRCYDTGENLSAEIKRLRRKLEPKGIQIELIETKLNYESVKESNSILVNGIKIEEIIELEISENFCESCSDLLGKQTFCRSVFFEGQEYEEIPVKAIRKAVMKILMLDEDSSEDEAKTSCRCCDGTCC